ncbi:DNA-directed RNA polymerase III polypeptide [Histoplasma capsulatum]|uniref:DNA-directed RNA polymerase III polypeptide n=1 Tax=Ajellomyces capsulatus TaxID=5037 RepID=A0A8A1MFZ7_AJECA|nr:DNA-directed RNA polymerase III polypeptide [Histoplasma capsulatum]
MPLTFCPNCSNALTISRADPSPRYPLGVNRFECRTCPYQYILDRTYYERTEMKRKEVSDVLGGKDEWKNADSQGMHNLRGSMERKLGQRQLIESPYERTNYPNFTPGLVVVVAQGSLIYGEADTTSI